MEEEEEELLCREGPRAVVCGPEHDTAPPEGTASATESAEVCALDEATGDLITAPPPVQWDMRADTRPHPPLADLGDWHAPEPAPAPAPAPAPRPETPEEVARREAAWRAEEDREMAREAEEERAREAEQAWRDERDRREAEDNPLLRDEAIERDFSIDDDDRGRVDGFDLRSPDGAYVYGEHNERGTTAGIGIGHETGDTLDVDGPSAHVGWGEWYDQDGRRYRGLRATGGLFSLEGHGPEEANPDSGSFSAGTFDVGAYDDGETFTIGAQAGIVDVGAASGTMGDARSDSDTSVGVSAGVGPGGALRLHHGDADHDGVREAGFGVSAFDFGFDVRSEYLGQLVNYISDMTPEQQRAAEEREARGAQRPIR